jgi:polyphosphate kinase
MTPEHAVATSAEATAGSPSFDLDSHEWYLNRELTWLNFNSRVLCEGEDPRTPLLERVKFTPLLERVKFLAIVSSNLDEFFMKRIGGLMQQAAAGVTELSPDGRTPTEQIDACHEVVRDLKARQRQLAVELTAALAEQGIHLTRYEAFDAEQKAEVREHYKRSMPNRRRRCASTTCRTSSR